MTSIAGNGMRPTANMAKASRSRAGASPMCFAQRGPCFLLGEAP